MISIGFSIEKNWYRKQVCLTRAFIFWNKNASLSPFIGYLSGGSIYSNAGPRIQNSKIRLFKYLLNKIQISIAPHLIFQKCSWNVLFNVTLLINQYHSDIKLKISNYFANGIYINECNMMRSKRWQLETGGPCSTASFKTFLNHSFPACKELKCF